MKWHMQHCGRRSVRTAAAVAARPPPAGACKACFATSMSLLTPSFPSPGFDAFRGRQLDAIKAALRGQDSFVLMPTGQTRARLHEQPPGLPGGGPCCVCPGGSMCLSGLQGAAERKSRRAMCGEIIRAALQAGKPRAAPPGLVQEEASRSATRWCLPCGRASCSWCRRSLR